MSALEPRDHALERGVVRAAASIPVPVLDVHLTRKQPYKWNDVVIETIHLPGHCLAHGGHIFTFNGKQTLIFANINDFHAWRTGSPCARAASRPGATRASISAGSGGTIPRTSYALKIFGSSTATSYGTGPGQGRGRPCAAARASEGILHISPPYISTEEDIDFIVETVNLVLDDLEGVILGRPEW